MLKYFLVISTSLRSCVHNCHTSAVCVAEILSVEYIISSLQTYKNKNSLQTWNTFGSVLQSQCRKYLARLHYMKIKKAAITTQCAWRGRVARKELRNLKMVTTSSFIIFSFYFIGSYVVTLFR